MKQEITAWMWDGKTFDGPAGQGAPREYRETWSRTAAKHKLKGKAGETTLVLDGPSPSIILGIKAEDTGRAVYEGAIRAVEIARKHRFAALRIGGVPSSAHLAAIRGGHDGQYSFRIGRKKSAAPIKVRVSGASAAVVRRAGIIGDAVTFARNLVNTPPGEKYPARLAARIIEELKRAKAAGGSVTMEIWDERKLAREKCAGVLAVGQGSSRPPRIVRMNYHPRGARRHIALVGKGVTFDAGGLNIKTFEGMKTMKCDMSGAAAVAAAFSAIVRLKLPVRVSAIIGLAENMLGGGAFKPGDVVTMRSGRTVEILNTDAEGRIVLGDLLDIMAKSKADCVVDLATLTGACLVALGEETAGLFANDDALAKKISSAGATVGEMYWRLPLGRDYLAKLKGDISDLKNIGGRYGGSCTAAQFLQEFIGDRKWAHLDIAGPAFREGSSSGRPGGATGFGTATLVELVGELA